MIRYYTDHHNVDEDITASSIQGGYWNDNITAGITQRHVDDSPTGAFGNVASYVCEHHLLTLDGYHNVGHKIPTDQLIRMYLYLYKFS